MGLQGMYNVSTQIVKQKVISLLGVVKAHYVLLCMIRSISHETVGDQLMFVGTGLWIVYILSDRYQN